MTNWVQYQRRENSVKLLVLKRCPTGYYIFQTMIKKLYVGNLSWETTDESLSSAFAQAGNVISATVIKDKFSGRSKGFGFVEMEEAEANAAVEMWNEKELDGRNIKVNEARPMEDRPPRRDNFSRSGDRGGFGGGRSGGSRY